MPIINKHIIFVEEDKPGDKWLDFYQKTDDGYIEWFLKEGDFKRPTLADCRQALSRYMPELIPIWERLCQLTQADDNTARMLSLYCPTPYVSGCSQAVWSRYTPVLVRNYDYTPALFEGRVQKSKWFDTEVIASTDCLWGVLDGMNEHGLAVSLTYGGSDIVGEGFGIPLILRYVLEFSQTTEQAIKILQRIPSNMSYNITITDHLQHTVTLELSPIEAPKVTYAPFAVNHQADLELSSYALFSNSYERKQCLIERLSDPMITLEAFIDSFSYAPLYTSNYQNNFGTLYTAIYNSHLKAMEYRWPNHINSVQSFQQFQETQYWVQYG